MDSILEFQHVSKHFKNFSLNDISFSLDKGFIMGLVGPNGAGKTTLLHLLMNQFKSYEGNIFVNGINIKDNKIATRQCIGFVSEANHFFSEYDAMTNINLYSFLYDNFDLNCFEHYARIMNVPLHANPLSIFSKGTLVKFQLAFAIAHHPLLYVLDEPTAGLDPVFRRDFLRILQEVVANENASVLISSHITSDLDKIADYIAFLDQGELKLLKDKESLEEEFRSEHSNAHFHVSDLF